MEFSKSEILLTAVIGSLIAIILVMIGKFGVYQQTGCWGECEPECSAKQCAASIDIKRYGLDGEQYGVYHEVPAPSTLLLMGAGVGIMLKMRG